MLSRITIKNLVIVRSLDLEFTDGMTALTGETGAGKSILIDALGLALGDKADSGMIRDGADKAEISAAFDLAANSTGERWLDAHDLAADGECLVRRVLVRNGRSRAYINGSPAPVAMLRELGDLLIDIHGQHAHQSLVKSNAQRELLDEFAELRAQADQVAVLFDGWHALREQHAALLQASSDRANRLDYLHFQLEELDGVVCSAGELAELDAEQGRLAHAERLLGETSQVLSILDNEDASLLHSLNQAVHMLSDLGQLDSSLDEPRELLESAVIQIDEAASGLRHYQDGVELDPQRLQQIDERLGRLHDTARKHRVAPADLVDLQQQLRDEADLLDNADNQLVQLEQQLGDSEASYRKAAKRLSSARSRAAVKLGKTISERMQTLGMQGGQFQVACIAEPERPGRSGIDRIRFLVAANPGQKAGALADVASGGELSRISLAIQVATADCGVVPTLIFDEVDVGIGGAVAEIVGQLLRRLGQERRVLCVTHLPQVAAQAHQQLRVQKTTDGKTTETRIDPLDSGARIDEISRMLGGVDITEQTRRHADEMIQHAQKTS